MQILIVYSINVSLVGTAFSQLVQFFQYFLDTIVDMNNAACHVVQLSMIQTLLLFSVDTRRCFNVYKTSILRR